MIEYLVAIFNVNQLVFSKRKLLSFCVDGDRYFLVDLRFVVTFMAAFT